MEDKFYILTVYYYHDSSPEKLSNQMYIKRSLEDVIERLNYARNHPRVRIVKYKVGVRISKED